LILLSLTAIVKGALIENYPVFQTLDPTILISIILFIGLGKQLLMGRWNLQTEIRKVIYTFLIYILILSFSFLYTVSPNYGIEKIARFVVFGVPMFFSPFLLLYTPQDSKRLGRMFIFVTMVLIVVVILRLIYLGITGGFLTYLLRVSVLNANPIQLGRYLSIGATMMFVYMLRKDWKKSILYLIIFFIFLLGMVATGSRGPLVSLFIGCIIYALIFEPKNRSKLLIYSTLALISVLLLFFILPESITKRFFDITGGGVLITPRGIKRVSTVATRLSFWHMSYSSWISSLKLNLFGLGAGGFSNLFIWRDWHWYPHNLFFETLAELGTVGLIILVLLFYYSFKSIRKGLFRQQLTEHSAFWVASMIVMFMAAQFSGDINDNRVFWMLLGLSLASINVDLQHRNKSV